MTARGRALSAPGHRSVPPTSSSVANAGFVASAVTVDHRAAGFPWLERRHSDVVTCGNSFNSGAADPVNTGVSEEPSPGAAAETDPPGVGSRRRRPGVVAYVLLIALIAATCIVAVRLFGASSSSQDRGCAVTASCGGASKPPPANLPS